jgi:hypothetical protein
MGVYFVLSYEDKEDKISLPPSLSSFSCELTSPLPIEKDIKHCKGVSYACERIVVDREDQRS